MALLLLGFVSVTPEGGMTVALLITSLVLVDDTVALTVYVTLFPAPAGILTVSLIFPEWLVVQDAEYALPAATQVHVAPVRDDGMESETAAPVTSLGPLLVTTIVYVIDFPGSTSGRGLRRFPCPLASCANFVMARSTAGLDVRMAVFDVAPVPPSVEVMVLVVLSNVPTEVAVTLTEKVHVPFAGIVPELKVNVEAPVEGLKIPQVAGVVPV